MKPGDKAWVFEDFDVPAIREVTIKTISQKKGERPKYTFSFNDDIHDYGEYWSFNVFPTREALCKHYRKVFE